MKRLKYLAMAALVAFAACDEGDGLVSSVDGTISGTVTAEGTGVAGVTVTLAGPTSQTATTGANGSYSFTGLNTGAYAVTISGVPADYVFGATSQSAVITADNQNVTVSFSGSVVRSASISGQVTAGGAGLEGVAVMIAGPEGNETKTTGGAGQFAFTGLRSGSYTVSITNPDPDVFTFGTTTQSVTLTPGESEIVNFAATGVVGEQASVAIERVLNAATGAVLPSNGLTGNMIIQIGVDEGNEEVTELDVFFGDNLVCEQSFSSSSPEGPAGVGESFDIDCTVNSGALDEDGNPLNLNGPITIRAVITTASGEVRTATLTGVLTNNDTFVATITPADEANSPATGLLWWQGPIDITVTPVMYSGRTAARVTVSVGGVSRTDTTPEDGFTFTFPLTGTNNIGSIEAMNVNITASGVTATGANFATGTILTTQNIDNVAPTFTDATGNIPVARWVNDDFEFGGITATDGGVGGTTITFAAGTTASSMTTFESVEELAETLTNNTYVVRVTITDELGNSRFVYIDGTAAGTTTFGSGTLIGVDFGDPVISNVTGLTDGEEIDAETTINFVLALDDLSGYSSTPMRIYVQRYTATSGPTCVVDGSGATGCQPASFDTSFDFTVDPVTGWPTDAYYESFYYAVDNALNESEHMDQLNVRDMAAPTVGGFFFAASLDAGANETFTAPAADNLDMDSGSFALDYSDGINPAVRLQMSEENLGGFGYEDGFVTEATFSTTVDFIGWIQNGIAGAFLNPVNAYLEVTDFGMNVGSNTTAIPAANVNAPAQTSWSDAGRPASTQITAATFVLSETTVCGDFDADGCAAASETETDATLTIEGATGQLTNLFPEVYLYVMTASGAWERVGQATTTFGDDGVTRQYFYDATIQGTDFNVAGAQSVGVLAVAANGTALWMTAAITLTDD